MKFKVDQNKCIGCGNCVAVSENKIFDFNDEGLAEVITAEVPDELLDTAKECMEQCPTQAIEEE